MKNWPYQWLITVYSDGSEVLFIGEDRAALLRYEREHAHGRPAYRVFARLKGR